MTFGDDDPLDSYVEGNVADPVQVARRVHEFRREHGLEVETYDELDEGRRSVLVLVAGALLVWLRREGGP